MSKTLLWAFVRQSLVASTITIALATTAWAGNKYKVLHSFDCTTDGCGYSVGYLSIDARGHIYGTGPGGGAYNGGTIFELAPTPHGLWNLKVLHNLVLSEGGTPVSGVLLDAAGNLYGTALVGGTHDSGTVFELTRRGTLNVLHSFDLYGGDGAHPWAGLVLDNFGNLYGTTQDGGAYGGGIVFKLAQSSGGWTEIVPYDFGRSTGQDGGGPEAGLIWDTAGNLYGTARFGGLVTQGCSAGCGTVFKLTPTSVNSWEERVLHHFDWAPGARDGQAPYAGLVFDGSGSLYGTTVGGGSDNRCGGGCGTIFKLAPNARGKWKETILHSFHLDHNGYAPFAGLVRDKFGNLYGTTTWDSVRNLGTVFKLTPRSNGQWTYSTVHRFTGPEGGQSTTGLIFDKKGNLYGKTNLGGTHNDGVVFEITP